MEPLTSDLMKKLEMLERKKVAFDIGAGTGYFTVYLARIFEKVYAVERDFEKAKEISKRGIKNVGVIVTDKPPEIDFEVDFVLFANSLHEIEDKEEYVRWVERFARSLAIIEWRKDRCLEIGPPKEIRLDVDDVLKLFKNFEFDVTFYDCHYLLFAVR